MAPHIRLMQGSAELLHDRPKCSFNYVDSRSHVFTAYGEGRKDPNHISLGLSDKKVLDKISAIGSTVIAKFDSGRNGA